MYKVYGSFLIDFKWLLGSCRLCRHNFENNRCAWEFVNNPGIIGNFLRIMSDTS